MLPFRLPVELTGVQLSLMPLHSVTASALFTSLLSLHNHNWGCLSEGIVGREFSIYFIFVLSNVFHLFLLC